MNQEDIRWETGRQMLQLSHFMNSAGHYDDPRREAVIRRLWECHQELCKVWYAPGTFMLSEPDQRRLAKAVAEINGVNGQNRLWAFSEKQLRRRFEQAAEGVRLLAQDERADVRAVVRRLLWAPESTYADVFGWLMAPEFGYPPFWGSNGVTKRFEFIRDFVVNGLLDDADPGAMWVRYATDEESEKCVGMSQCVPCAPNEEGAWEVITPYRETGCAAYYVEAYLTPERVIRLIDWHEAREAERVAFFREDGADDEDLGDYLKIDASTAAIREWMRAEGILPDPLPPEHGKHAVA